MLFRRIQKKDIAEADLLFKASITDLVTRENIKESKLIEEEVTRLNDTVRESLIAQEPLFFVTEINGIIVGSIALTKPNSLIFKNISIKPNLYEVGCVYVHPDYQRQGIGSFMFNKIKQELVRLGHIQFYLDAGFSSSQQYWKQLLGKPTFVIENYWGEGAHHLIWLKDVT